MDLIDVTSIFTKAKATAQGFAQRAGFTYTCKQASGMDLKPRYVTLGTYREKNNQLDTWRKKGGLPPMEWEPEELVREGTHFHLPEEKRIAVYRTVAELSRKYLPESRVSLCKETHTVRKALGLCNADCNCLI